jgi:hypothetical protein
MALDYMRDNASSLAIAKAERVFIEEFRKSKKALLVQDSKGTVLERESYAYAHPEYIEVLEGLKEAVQKEEELRWMMVAAQAKIEVWRTQAANNRLIDRAHQ